MVRFLQVIVSLPTVVFTVLVGASLLYWLSVVLGALDVEILGGADGARLAALADDPGVGIVLLEEQLQRALPPEFVQRLERQARPLVAAFPSPRFEGSDLAAQDMLELLRRAIGYRVRLP